MCVTETKRQNVKSLIFAADGRLKCTVVDLPGRMRNVPEVEPFSNHLGARIQRRNGQHNIGVVMSAFVSDS